MLQDLIEYASHTGNNFVLSRRIHHRSPHPLIFEVG